MMDKMEKIFEIEAKLIAAGKAVPAAVALAFVWVLVMMAAFGLMVRFS